MNLRDKLRAVGGNNAGAARADQRSPAVSGIRQDLGDIMRGDLLRAEHKEPYTRIDRFKTAAFGCPGRSKAYDRIKIVRLPGFRDRVIDGNAMDGLPALPRRDAGHNSGSRFDHQPGLHLSGFSRDSLNQDPGVPVDQYGHVNPSPQPRRHHRRPQ